MYRQSQACFEMKDFDEAKSILTETLKLDPENKGKFWILDWLINEFQYALRSCLVVDFC